MRIAVFTDSFYPELGGIQDSILATARALGAAGHAVAIFAPQPARRDFARAGLPVAEPVLGANVAVHRLFALPAPGSTGQSRLALPWRLLAPGRGWAVLDRFRPDVIHSHTFLGVGWAAVGAARRLGVPLIGTNHWAIGGFGLYAPACAEAACVRAAWHAVAAYYNRCTWVSAPSRDTFREMQAHGLRRPGAAISNPIDTACFRPPEPGEQAALKQRLGLAGPTVLFAGRLAREKRIDVLIRALPVLRRRLPGATLVLAGHGSARPTLAALAAELGVAAHVRFTGTLDHAALAELCRAADAFAIASTSESQSMVLLQAMSAGLPAVAARQGPLVEYLPDTGGMLAAPGDADAFAAALAAILADPERRAAMAARAVVAAARFGVTAVADTWLDVYARVGRGALSAALVPPAWSPSCA
jgi:1,2-diacylglycerol 3-alpha-glucosyltransferase